MNELRESIELGKQRGFSSSFKCQEIEYWCSTAIEKYCGEYKAHVSIISETEMVLENYKVYFTRAFATLDEAIACIEKHSPHKFVSFIQLKGQKIFSPEINEENEI